MKNSIIFVVLLSLLPLSSKAKKDQLKELCGSSKFYTVCGVMAFGEKTSDQSSDSYYFEHEYFDVYIHSVDMINSVEYYTKSNRIEMLNNIYTYLEKGYQENLGINEGSQSISYIDLNSRIASIFEYSIFDRDRNIDTFKTLITVQTFDQINKKILTYQLSLSDDNRTDLKEKFNFTMECFKFKQSEPNVKITLGEFAHSLNNQLFSRDIQEPQSDKIAYEKKRQGYVHRGNKSYNCSRPLYFKLKKKFYSDGSGPSTVQLAVAKRQNNSGIAYLKFDDSNNIGDKKTIVGSLYIYLESGKVIECIDRNFQSHLDNESSTLYYLTSDEIKTLSKYKVLSIAFSVKRSLTRNPFSGSSNHSAVSKEEDTRWAVKALFE